MIKRIVFSMLIMMLALGMAACYGPRPMVVRQELRPPSTPGGAYTLVVTLANQNGGEGQADVTARLRSKATGATVAQQDQTVTLQPHETVQLTFSLQADTPGDYDATVEAQYPPE
jgi:hypothetical protein